MFTLMMHPYKVPCKARKCSNKTKSGPFENNPLHSVYLQTRKNQGLVVFTDDTRNNCLDNQAVVMESQGNIFSCFKDSYTMNITINLESYVPARGPDNWPG